MGGRQYQYRTPASVTKKNHVRERDLKTAITAFVSALIGGSVSTVSIYLGVLGLEERSEEVTFKVAQTPTTSGKGVDLGGEVGPSVREVYTRDGPEEDLKPLTLGDSDGVGGTR